MFLFLNDLNYFKTTEKMFCFFSSAAFKLIFEERKLSMVIFYFTFSYQISKQKTSGINKVNSIIENKETAVNKNVKKTF